MELGHGVLIMLLFSVLLNVGIVEPQRVSLVDRLKALDKGIRQGLQRQKSTDPSGTNPATDQQQVQDEVQPVTIEEQPTSLQQQVLSPEDTDGTSDVVRQLTASYEDDVDVSISFQICHFFESLKHIFVQLSSEVLNFLPTRLGQNKKQTPILKITKTIGQDGYEKASEQE